MKLRPYQEDAITALESWFATESIEKHPLLSLPTASGKTVIFSNFIKRTIKKYSDAGSFFIFNKENYFKTNYIPKKTTFIKLKNHMAVDVNDKKDLKLLEVLYKK